MSNVTVDGVELEVALRRARQADAIGGGGMRQFLLGLALAVVMIGFFATPAPANSKNAEARVIMQRFAACVVEREPDLASQFVLKQVDERLPERDFQKLLSWKCLTGTSPSVASLRMRNALLRGALAEELVRREMTSDVGLDLASVPPLEWNEPVVPSLVDKKGRAISTRAMRHRETQYLHAIADNYVSQLGECVVRIDSRGAKTAVMAPLDSPAELAAMKAMSDKIASCVIQGQTLKFNRTTLRAALAVSYYRLVVVARATQPKGTVG